MHNLRDLREVECWVIVAGIGAVYANAHDTAQS
jgi:hypothetical protein